MTPQTQRDGKRKGHWDTGRDYERETGILRETKRDYERETDGQTGGGHTDCYVLGAAYGDG